MNTSTNRPTTKSRLAAILAAAALSLTTMQSATAGMPVIDVAAITQLILQIRTLADQLKTARDQLTQAKDEYKSMTGKRGMERLLSGTQRNYLPSNWNELNAVMKGASGAHSSLAASLRTAIESNAILTPQQIASLSQKEREQLAAARHGIALMQVTAREALTATSARFASIQQLINAIPGAADQKAILDLQARISAEQSMLQNEQTKLEMLYQAANAEEMARRQRLREHAISDIGSLRRLPAMGL